MNRNRVIVALDLDSPEKALEIARTVSSVFPFFKIGMKLFTQMGPSIVKETLKFGKVFLDLKFYDIPTIVADAVVQAARLGVSLLTIHASGGPEMMQLCVQRSRELGTDCKLLAVTVLTSFEKLDHLGISNAIPDQVHLLAQLAQNAGMDGIVCSPNELEQIRSIHPPPFLLVTPGIRGATDTKGDQKRVSSAADALRSGADYLVIGRPIVAAPDPQEAARKIAREIG